MIRLTIPLILAAALFGAHLTETAWSKVNHHQIHTTCGAC
jgi:hypothetical protein